MNITDFEKLSAKLVFTAAVIGSTLFAGAKHGSPTNTPPMMAMLPPQTETEPPLSNSNSTSSSLTNWHARGAWTDWQKISFPAGFRFPVGTNFIHEVTLMSYGEIRSSLRPLTANSQQLTATLAEIPEPLALRPGVSSVAYGLTASNSLLFAWRDAFANREPTNRVNAEIELFTSGACIVRLDTVETPIPAPLPPDIVGEGQDEDWVRANFGDDADRILMMGYENWLANEWVGVDVQNGHYQTAVTVPALPADGSPCYLFCGRFKVNVTSPGTYRFPMEVFETYETRTYPVAMPLSLSYDDGYTGEGESFEIVEVSDTPPLLMTGASQGQNENSAANTSPAPQPYLATFYRNYMLPKVVVTPSRIPIETASGTRVTIWCNIANAVIRSIRGVANLAYLQISGSEIEIREANVAGWYEVMQGSYERNVIGMLELYQSQTSTNETHETNICVRTDASIFSGSEWQSELTNDMSIVHLTAVTESGSTDENLATAAVQLLEGQSAYVGVYLASSEHPNNPFMTYYDDIVSWQVLSSGIQVMTGTASASDWNREAAIGSYGGLVTPVFLGGQFIEAASDETLHLRLVVTAQNVTDGLRETAVQIVLYPVDAYGNVIGLP